MSCISKLIKRLFKQKQLNNINITTVSAMLLLEIKELLQKEKTLNELELIQNSGFSYKEYQCLLNKLIKSGFLEKKKNVFKILKDVPKYVPINPHGFSNNFKKINYKEDKKGYFYLNSLEPDSLISINSKMYHDILICNSPDYKSIEAIGILHQDVPYKQSKFYKDYEVFSLTGGKINIPFNWIKIMGSNLSPHLLAFLISEHLFKKDSKIKFSIITKSLNEKRENINKAFNVLQKLDLLEFKERSNFIQFSINKNEVDKISPKRQGDFNTKEINQYYVLNLLSEDEEEQERIDFAQKMLHIEQPKIY